MKPIISIQSLYWGFYSSIQSRDFSKFYWTINKASTAAIIPTSHVYLYIVLHTCASLDSIDYYVTCFKSLYYWHHKVYIFLQLVFPFLSQYFILGDFTLDICRSGSFSLQFNISLWLCHTFKKFLLMFKWFIFF